jgi:hypothetical protein
MRRRKSLRIGVHNANAVVWGPVYRTHLRSPRSRRDFVLGGGASTRGRGSLGRGRVLRLRGGERERQGDHDAVLVVVQARFLRRDDAGAAAASASAGAGAGAGGAAGAEWQALDDGNGRTYYYSPVTGVSQWEKPPGM